VVDGYLDAIEADVLAGFGSQRKRADEDPAVASLADLEVERQFETGAGRLVDHHVAAAAVGVDALLLHRRPAGRAAAGLPALERLAVEEQDPALRFLLRRQLVIGREERSGRHDPGENSQGGSHDGGAIQSLTSKMASISTAIPPGSDPIPTALRAPLPGS